MNNSLTGPSTNGIILMYHRVADVEYDPWSISVSPNHFSEQMEVVKQIFHPVQLSDIFDKNTSNHLPSPWVAITFDDGYADNLYYASKILREYEIPATFFLVSRYINSKEGYWWDILQELLLRPGSLPSLSELSIKQEFSEIEWQAATLYSTEEFERYKNWHFEADVTPRHVIFRKLYSLLRIQSDELRNSILKELIAASGSSLTSPVNGRILSSEELKQLVSDKLFQIGSHTMTHANLESLPIWKQKREILDSKAMLEGMINTTVNSFSYPHGFFTHETVSLVKDAGFDCACTVDEGVVQESTDRYLLPRLAIYNWDGNDFTDFLVDFSSRHRSDFRNWTQNHKIRKEKFTVGAFLLKRVIDKEAVLCERDQEIEIYKNNLMEMDQQIQRLNGLLVERDRESLNLDDPFAENQGMDFSSTIKTNGKIAYPSRKDEKPLKEENFAIGLLRNMTEYLLIQHSGLFDRNYYQLNYPDIRKADVNPLMHFIKYGWKEGRNPSSFFDVNFYLNTYQDVEDSGINPLIHYIRFGVKEGRKANANDIPQYNSD